MVGNNKMGERKILYLLFQECIIYHIDLDICIVCVCYEEANVLVQQYVASLGLHS